MLTLYDEAEPNRKQEFLNKTAFLIASIDEGRREYNGGREIYEDIIGSIPFENARRNNRSLARSVRKRMEEIARGNFATKSSGAVDDFIEGHLREIVRDANG